MLDVLQVAFLLRLSMSMIKVHSKFQVGWDMNGIVGMPKLMHAKNQRRGRYWDATGLIRVNPQAEPRSAVDLYKIQQWSGSTAKTTYDDVPLPAAWRFHPKVSTSKLSMLRTFIKAHPQNSIKSVIPTVNIKVCAIRIKREVSLYACRSLE